MERRRNNRSNWMAGSVGVSSHWTADTLRRDGSHPVFAEAVAAFDVQAYADALASAGATHCIFTLAHARQFLPMPLPELDRILSGRTAARDLMGGLIEALSRRGIRFIAYYNHSCNGRNDPAWKEACGYAAGEAVQLDEPFAPPPLPGKQDHRWICLDSPDWVFAKVPPETGFEVPPRFPDDALAAYIREHTAAGRMVTFNILIDAAGRINQASLAQLRRCLLT